MKKSILFLSIIVWGLLVMTSSCRKYETQPKDWFTSELTFDSLDKNGTVTAFNLNNIYTYLPTGYNWVDLDFLDAGTDDALPSRINATVENYSKGTVNLINNPDPYWGTAYYGIRRANIFLKNVVRTPISASNMQFWKAEARFLRAYFYWELLKRYGGVPLLGDTVLGLNDHIEIPRATYAETVDYIVKECTAIKDSLRADPASDAEWGRASKGAAVALKCRVLLYAASPLFNGGGVESDATKKALTGYLTADATRWQKVADAVTEFKALGYYNLVPAGTAPAGFINVFINKKNTEIIFARQSPNSSTLENFQSPVGYTVSNVQCYGLTSPSQNLVDAFPMRNGLAITDAGSGYNAANPYASRDPRLDATVFYNGLMWLNRTVKTYQGGADKPDNPTTSQVQTRTGYYLRKFLGSFTSGNGFSNQSHNFPIFRFAEILLTNAEALNELGLVENAVAEIIRLRTRAGITAGSGNRYGIKAGITQTEMRELIRNERRIELAFEEHRFWDIRRWKIASQVMNAPITGMKITNGTPLTYQVVTVANPVFQNRLYHMPIPYDEILKNPKLIQNEGW
ncbi:RagB/SusD family nutrient uptake outer membrane protein [Niastella caeni]|uniref:RagB/SusD family nutrient uptake outer membrane protein n=1 Tax=Niastella caeni TaxID=2569763 RepID=A0A4S8HIH5_9BACT|nr:RagB/SusD family nutrient uptake outer membrane protein [Niastella caeni]THU34927.1 RagB/SusD family nutrient uptake outer membrane protein [Niastella caeni]